MKREHWLALGGYSALTLVLTWPVWVQLDQPPLGGDPSQNVWNLWWIQKAVGDPGRSLLWTDYLNAPAGASLALHSLSKLNGFLALPLLGTMSYTAALRVLLLLTFPVAGWGMYFLARRAVERFWPAFIAGGIYAFCPHRMVRFNLEQIDILSSQWIPFYVLFLLNFLDRRSVRAAAGAAIMTILTALAAWYHAGHLVLVTLFLGIVYFASGRLPWRSRAFASGLAVLVLVPLAVLAIDLVPMVRESLQPESRHQDQVTASLGSSSDLVSYFVPDGYWPQTLLRFGHAYLGWSAEAAGGIYRRFASLKNESTSFPGYALLALLLFAAVRRKREHRLWLWGAAVFFVLSLGPLLHVMGVASLPLPYVLINRIPGLSVMRAPNRVNILFILSAAMIAALVLRDLSAAGRRKWAWAFVLVLIAEYLTVPVQRQHNPPPVSPLLRDVRTLPGDTVLQIPEALSEPGAYLANWYMALQTEHEKKILGGYTSRIHYDAQGLMDRYPAIRALEWTTLFGPSRDPRAQQDAVGAYRLEAGVLDTLPAALAELGVRQVLLHKAPFAANPGTLIHLLFHLERRLGRPVFEDATLAVFDVKEREP